MDEACERAWQQYLAAEVRNHRPELLARLNEFIDALLQTESWRDWGKAHARARCEESAELPPLRFPLLQKIVVPALCQGVCSREPHCARWLAQLWNLLGYALPEELLPRELQDEWALFREAIRQDARDDTARRLLATSQMEWFHLCLHELPSGVLWGFLDGATPAQTANLLTQLEECEGLLIACGELARHRRFIDHCRFHFESWGQYLVSERSGESYQAWCLRVKGVAIA